MQLSCICQVLKLTDSLKYAVVCEQFQRKVNKPQAQKLTVLLLYAVLLSIYEVRREKCKYYLVAVL